MSKKEDKSPYTGYTIEEIMATEFGNYVIQIGSDLFKLPNGKMAFNKERAEMLYDDLLAGLLEMKKSGDKVQREDAIKCLLHMRMHPLRIH